MPTVVGANDLQPGDFVFVEKKPGDQLGLLIVELDRSDFSHVGFVNADRRVVSARTHGEIKLSPPDIGGVEANTIEELFGDTPDRKKWLGRNHFTDEQIEAATERTRPWIEPNSADVSGFSFAKLFIVSAALDAVHVPIPGHPALSDEQSRHLLDKALKTAAIWDYRNMPVPGFFCSELVAAAFDLKVPVDKLAPPRPPTGEEGESLTVGGQSMEELGLALHVDMDDNAHKALHELVRTAFAYDHYFATRAVTAAIGFVLEKAIAIIKRIFHVNITFEEFDDHLPPALVTPRLLRDLSIARGGELQEIVL